MEKCLNVHGQHELTCLKNISCPAPNARILLQHHFVMLSSEKVPLKTVPSFRHPFDPLSSIMHENRDVSWPNLPIVHTQHTQRQMHGVKQPFEELTEQQGLLLKGFSLQVLSQAFHHNHAQLRQGAGVGGICCTFPLLATYLPPSLPSLKAFLLPISLFLF